MSMTATPPIAVTEFDALMPHNSAPISQQTNTAFFFGAGISLVRRISATLCAVAPGTAAAIEQLAAVEPRLAQVVEMRYFGGLSMQEIAEAMDVTERTIARDWTKARSLLAAMLSA